MRDLGYSRDSIYTAAHTLERSGLLVKFRDGKEVVAALSPSPEARRRAELYVTAVAHGVDPEAFDRGSIRDTWSHLAERRGASVAECAEALPWSYESVRRAFHFLLDAGLARADSRRPLRISLEDAELNRHLRRHLLGPSGTTVFTLSTAPFTKFYGRPSQVRELLLSEEGPFLIRGVERTVRPGRPVTIVEVMVEEVTRETVFLRELGRTDGVEEFCIQILSSRSVDFEGLLRLSRERGDANVVGCYLDILSDLSPDLVAKEDAERFLPFVSWGDPPAFLAADKEFGKEGWEGPYEDRWNVDLYLDRGAIEHGIRAVS
jgi:hypothetical protein